jgi:hypothetical protein
VDDILSEIDGLTFVEHGRRCSVCSEEFIDQKDANRTVKVARQLGVWGAPLKPKRKLSRSGRGIILRIPEDLRQSLGPKGTEAVVLSKVGTKKILVELE